MRCGRRGAAAVCSVPRRPALTVLAGRAIVEDRRDDAVPGWGRSATGSGHAPSSAARRAATTSGESPATAIVAASGSFLIQVSCRRTRRRVRCLVCAVAWSSVIEPSRKARELAHADGLLQRARERPRGEDGAQLVQRAVRDHPVHALVDPPSERLTVGRQGDERVLVAAAGLPQQRPLSGPPRRRAAVPRAARAPPGPAARGAGWRGRREPASSRVPAAQLRGQRGDSFLRQPALQVPAQRGVRRRAEPQASEGGTHVESAAALEHHPPAARQQVVDGPVSQRGRTRRPRSRGWARRSRPGDAARGPPRRRSAGW